MTPTSPTGTVREVGEQHLCVQCGACVVVCADSSIELVESPGGLLEPRIDQGKCTECGACLEICPGKGVAVEGASEQHLYSGSVTSAHVGHSADPAIRLGAQSGGLVTALLNSALDAGLVDAALVTSTPEDGSLLPSASLARTRSEVIQAWGSKYLAVPIMLGLAHAKPTDRLAVVGLPCHVHAIRNLMVAKSPLVLGVKYIVGLFCDRVTTRLSVDLITESAGYEPSQVSSIRYKSKLRSGWPGEVRFLMKDGSECFFPPSLRKKLNDPCTPPRCRLCFDKTNVLADISVGDPWGVELPYKGKDGYSVALARTERGQELLRVTEERGHAELSEIDPEVVFSGQRIDLRKRDVAGFSAAWSAMGRPLPKPVDSLANQITVGRDAQKVRSYRKRLLFNIRIAESSTRDSALKELRARLRRDRMAAQLGLGTMARTARKQVSKLPRMPAQSGRGKR